MNKKKLVKKLLTSVKNVKFSEATALAEAIGFKEDRTKGSHHIFVHPDITQLLNLQEVKGEARPYQVRQLVKLIEKYNLSIKD